jgi:heme exporter protein CcmD
MNVAPFVDGSYATTLVFLVAVCGLTWSRYRRARRRLAAVDTRL